MLDARYVLMLNERQSDGGENFLHDLDYDADYDALEAAEVVMFLLNWISFYVEEFRERGK